MATRRATTHRTLECAVGYIRVSSEEQAAGDRWSLSAQRREIERYCQQRGWRLVKIYSDEGHSAKGSDLNIRAGLRLVGHDVGAVFRLPVVRQDHAVDALQPLDVLVGTTN